MKNKVVEKNLKRIMFEKGINQSELSRQMGLTRSVVSGWFVGKRNPKRDTLSKVADVLGIPVDSLFIDPDTQKNFVDNSGTIGNIGSGRGEVVLSTRQDLLEERNKRLELEIQLIKARLDNLEKKK